MSKKPEGFTKSGEGERLFENPVLHYFSKINIAVPLTIFYSAGIVLCAVGMIYFNLNFTNTLVVFIGGLLLFTLIEYLMHRFIFHLPNVYKKGHIPYALHGVHHEYPKDKDRLAMPPILSVFLASAILGVNYLIMGVVAFPFTAGVVVGYATYLCVHYSVHRYKMPNNFMKVLWVNHSIHHYVDDEKAFGVSSPLWDFVFRTLPDKRKK